MNFTRKPWNLLWLTNTKRHCHILCNYWKRDIVLPIYITELVNVTFLYRVRKLNQFNISKQQFKKHQDIIQAIHQAKTWLHWMHIIFLAWHTELTISWKKVNKHSACYWIL